VWTPEGKAAWSCAYTLVADIARNPHARQHPRRFFYWKQLESGWKLKNEDTPSSEIENKNRHELKQGVMSRAGQSSTFSSAKRRDILSSEAPQQSLVETKLVASDGGEGDQFGFPLAIGGDVLVIGAPNATIDGRLGAGAVYIFLRNSPLDPWVEHKRLVPNDGDIKSSEMTIAIDGETLVVGAPYNTLDKFQEGAVYIFERNAGGGDNWAQVAKLINLSVGFGGHFGSSVAIQGDLLAVGASASNQHHGQVQIFERDRGGAGNWGLVTTLSYVAAQDSAWGPCIRELGGARW
jgi:FG-GAP repeat